MQFKDKPGECNFLGSTISPNGVNFAVYSKRADFVELLLFDSEYSESPSSTYKLSPEHNRTSNYWHIFLEGCKAGQVYAWRAHGPFDANSGLRFDPDKILLDPYSCGIVAWNKYSREKACKRGENLKNSLKSIVLDTSTYDWEDDTTLKHPYADTIIYEMHVGGFSKNPNSGVKAENLGTYAGLVEKLPYLKELGVTAIELMPVHAFDKYDAAKGLTNYWGYSPISFFTPHLDYSSSKTAEGALAEFRDMVKACHKQDIEVILDVVFNHSAEGDENGPTLSFKGLDNLTYYTIDEPTGAYKNYSGCGNTLRSEHPIVSRLILDSLRFWAAEMHVDGFRFDLASILSRDIFGKPSERPAILWAIESDPILASSKLILEAWDSAGLYQVGWFVSKGNRFAEWNGPFRDDLRLFVRADSDSVAELAKRLSGSSDIYGHNRDPNLSINFVSCHDGFTLNDLVSYNDKHNELNLEGNADGRDDNCSWNCGHEGPTDKAEIEELRIKQIKNFLALLLLAPGTPMISMGDEVRRTLGGNNNAYCQDNAVNWFDWSLTLKNRHLFEFTSKLIKLRKRLSCHQNYFFEDTQESQQSHMGMTAELAPWHTLKWHGVELSHPDFSAGSHSLAFELREPQLAEHIYVVFNAYWEPLSFSLPDPGLNENWHKILDTALSYPDDIVEMRTAKAVNECAIKVAPRSIILLINTSSLRRTEKKMRQSKIQAERGITWTTNKRPS